MVGILPDIDMDEYYVKLREENIYFNPMQNMNTEIKNVNDAEVVSYQDSLKKCLNYSDVIVKNDLFLQKSLQILSCHRITSMLAQQYIPTDFN